MNINIRQKEDYLFPFLCTRIYLKDGKGIMIMVRSIKEFVKAKRLINKTAKVSITWEDCTDKENKKHFIHVENKGGRYVVSHCNLGTCKKCDGVEDCQLRNDPVLKI